MMENCWQDNPSERPNSFETCLSLQKLEFDYLKKVNKIGETDTLSQVVVNF